jgi:hypothetical protein
MSVHKMKDGRWYCKYYDEDRKPLKEYFGRKKEGEIKAREYDIKVNYYRLKAVALGIGCKPTKVHLQF